MLQLNNPNGAFTAAGAPLNALEGSPHGPALSRPHLPRAVMSVQEVEVAGASLHGVDDQLVAAVEVEHDDLEQSTRAVEPQAKLTGGAVLVRFAGKHPVRRGMHGVIGPDPELECRRLNLHAP